MEFRTLGRSGLKISEIAYGNWITHGGQVEADAAKACVREALDSGITTFDTADVNDRGLGRKHILESINGSLKRLGTDYVDLYQAHRFDYSVPLEETIGAFADV